MIRTYIYVLVALGCIPQGYLYAMELKIFNVGQGNCTVVKHPTEKTLLVDAGTRSFSSAMKPGCTYSQPTCMKRKKEEIAEYASKGNKPVVVIVSHGDSDHYGWIGDIITGLQAKNIEVSLVLGGIPSDYVADQKKNAKKKNAKKKNNTPLQKLVDKKKALGGTFASECTEEELQAMMPQYCTILIALTTRDDNRNKRSIVVRIDPLDMIIPGDADGVTTKALLKKHPMLTSHLYVAAHHGTHKDDCNEETFLKTLSPKVVFVSAGYRKQYHHPTGEFVQRALRVLPSVKDSIPHTVTFHPQGSEIETAHCRPFLRYENGYVSAMTTKLLFGTIDMDDMTIIVHEKGTRLYYANTLFEEVRNEHPNDRAKQYRACLMKSICSAPLKGITQINLTGSQLTDEDILTLDTLEPTVTECVLDDNPVTSKGVTHIMILFQDHPRSVALSLRSIALLVDELERNIRTRSSLKKLVSTFLLKNIVEATPNDAYLLPQGAIVHMLLTHSKDVVMSTLEEHNFYRPLYEKQGELLVFPAESYIEAWNALQVQEGNQIAIQSGAQEMLPPVAPKVICKAE